MFEYLLNYLDELSTIVNNAMDEPGVTDYAYDILLQVWHQLLVAIEILQRAGDSPFSPFILFTPDIE